MGPARRRAQMDRAGRIYAWRVIHARRAPGADSAQGRPAGHRKMCGHEGGEGGPVPLGRPLRTRIRSL